jgi:uncharacterized protein (TIGR00369 family)
MVNQLSAGSASSSPVPPGLVSTELMRQKSGLEVLRLVQRGEVPPPAMSMVIPVRLVEVEFGEAVFACQPSEAFLNTVGIVHGGFTMTVLDTCMGTAIYSTLPSGVGYVTIETKINFVRPIKADTTELKAIGVALHTGTRTGTAEGRLLDEAGNLYAHGTTTLFLFPLT